MLSNERRFSAAALPVGGCLFFSGFCALIYQTAWLREFRLVFGASTAASAAVLAIFMGGLGAGGIVLGRKSDVVGNPFLFYARLEMWIALSASVTPPLLWVVCRIYIALGGSLVLGPVGGAGLRLVLATLVLLAPTFLMGGTLPAAVQAVQSEGDERRRHIALLYGANTCGAVTGALLSTFFLFEHLGNRLTLWSACGVNLLVALVALPLSRRFTLPSGLEKEPVHSRKSSPNNIPVPASSSALVSPRFVLAAGLTAGFAFFLMEMVWYRMLTPLLGGSTFTFGLILAVALSGIATGSLAYAFFSSGRAVTVGGFACVCALEAMFIALPFALGDRLAVLAILLQPFGGLGFAARVATWGVIASIVVFPAAFFAGAQFPMLIALLGRGRTSAGGHTALAYSWNTAGAIAGSLAGGFGLFPVLGALWLWRLVVVSLLAMAACAAVVAVMRQRRWVQAGPAALGGALALWMLSASGPTAAWRHTPIGAGRVTVKETKRSSVNAFTDFMQTRRRNLVWEAEGIESSIGLLKDDGFSFIVNGKSDGSARGDAPTQVMLGLLGAMVHGDPRQALVVGLGTGSTAGWLAAVPGMERVDVVELEPAMRRVAEDCAPVNHNALANPKLHLWFGDGREAMLASRQQYDVIASEPSNPYRAGVASLFTREFYQAASKRLRPGGLLVQWVQAYEVDGESIRSIYATLCSVFPVVETWKTQNGDLAFMASGEAIIYNIARMRERVAQEPYRSALAWVWRVTDLEGVFGHYIADNHLSEVLAMAPARPNTDDRSRLEFGFARTVGSEEGFDMDKLSQLSLESHSDRPQVTQGVLDWEKVCDRRVSALVLDGRSNFESNSGEKGFHARTQAKAAYARGDFGAALGLWRGQAQEPGDLLELLLVAHSSVASGDARAPRYLEQLGQWFPCEANALGAQWLLGQQKQGEAFELAGKALRGLRSDPWPRSRVMMSALELAEALSKQNPGLPYATQLCETLQEPFAIRLLELERMVGRLEMAELHDPLHAAAATREALAEFEPHVPWTAQFLHLRLDSYARSHDRRAVAALEDLERFEAREAQPFFTWTREQSEAMDNTRRKSNSFSTLGITPVHAREK